jgi:Flp pilus assembly CpaE family ATPase
LDRAAVQRLRNAGMAVVAMAPDDLAARDRLRRLGIDSVVPDSAGVPGVAAAVVAAARRRFGSDDAAPEPPYPTEVVPARGQVVAVWGPAGAPGRSCIAVNLAAELAGLGHLTLCIDLDTYGPALAQLVGLLDEGSGLAAACRAANSGSLDEAGLRRLAVAVRPRLHLLTGVSGPHRWPELRPAGLEVLLQRARFMYRYVVADLGFCLEQDEELSYDTVAPRRNGAAVDVLRGADHVVAVAAADPIGITRFVAAVGDLPRRENGAPPVTVINRVRRSSIGRGEPKHQIALALGRYADIDDALMVPDDPATADAALAGGRLWSEVAPTSPARNAVRELARRVTGASTSAAPRRGRLALLRR